MATYGPYYGSFGGSFSNVYSQLQIDSWTVTSTQVTFTAKGGYYADYNWSINGISSELFWGENGSWYSMYYGDGFSISTGSGGGSAWWISKSDYFTRTAQDRYVYLANDLAFSGNFATARSATLTVPHLPSVPSNFTATRQSDTSIKLAWTNPSTSYSKMYIQVSVDGGSWTNVTNINSTTSYTYTSSANHAYKFRIRTYYESAYSDYVTSGTVYTTPSAPTSITATRNSDSKVTLAINMGSSNGSPQVERKVDGGSWSVLAQLAKGTTSYADTTTSTDHAYQYRLCAYAGSLKSSYVTSSTITMTPAAPTKMTTAASGGTNITVTLTNPSSVATKVQYQVSTDGGSTWGTTTDSASLTSFTVSAAGSNVKIRARNYNATGTSAWLESGTITTICPPAAPTLTAPSGNVLDIADGNVTFSWLHNSLDGSAQSAAQLDYSTDGGSTWTSITSITTAQSYTMAIPWSAGTTVTWRVKTKGADASYSPWSSTKSFNVYSAPTLSITSPGATVTGMPIQLTATYSDMAGFACQAATVSLTQNGDVLFSEPCTISGSAISAQLDTSEFLPANGESYTVVLTARSSSSLQSTANTTFTTSFTEPVDGQLEITNDPDTGYASLLAFFDNTGTGAPAVSISVSRVNADGTITQLLADGSSDTGIIDKYAPLNTPYQYAVTTTSSAQAIKTVYVDNLIETNRWFAYWGENIAWAEWNPKGSYTLTRPEKVRVHYAGRKWPVSYDSMAIEQRQTISWTVVSLNDWENGFIQLMEDGGRGVYKGCDGWVYHADFDYAETPEYTSVTRMGDVSLSITRIDGEQL